MGEATPLFLFQSHNQISWSIKVDHISNLGTNSELYQHLWGPSWEKQIPSFLAYALLHAWVVRWVSAPGPLLWLLYQTTYALSSHPCLQHLTYDILSDMFNHMQLFRDNCESKWDHDWTWRLLWGAAIILHLLPHTTSHCWQTSINSGSDPRWNHFSAYPML